MNHIELMRNRVKYMGLSLEDIYKRKEDYFKVIHK